MNSNYEETCLECDTLVPHAEYGIYCPAHRLDASGCCRNHCTLDEEGDHCVHCKDYLNVVIAIDTVLCKTIRCADASGMYNTAGQFNDLHINFNINYNPYLWGKELIDAIGGSSVDVYLSDDQYHFFIRGMELNDMDEFIKYVREFIRQKELTKENMYEFFEYSDQNLKYHLKNLIDILYEDIVNPIAIHTSEEEDEEEREREAFNNDYQILAPPIEIQNENLRKFNINLCPECYMPQSHRRLCESCKLDFGIVNPLM